VHCWRHLLAGVGGLIVIQLKLTIEHKGGATSWGRTRAVTNGADEGRVGTSTRAGHIISAPRLQHNVREHHQAVVVSVAAAAAAQPLPQLRGPSLQLSEPEPSG
jgi:hypothetical protein